MNIAGIIYDDVANGEGLRVTLFISGCLHDCDGCHNKSAQDPDYGKEFTVEMQDEIIKYVLDNPFIAGITLSGGDPIYQSEALCKFVKRFVKETKKNVWVYSGFTFEEILELPWAVKLLKQCDVLVDGLFVLAKRDTTLGFRGSPNQRIIDLKSSFKKKIAIDISKKFD